MMVLFTDSITKEYQFTHVKQTQVVSRCGEYRYALTREWDDTLPSIMYIALNPSDATHVEEDHTTKIMRARAVDYGYGKLVITNLFAYRSKSPKLLPWLKYPNGLDGDDWIMKYAREVDTIVACWGSKGLMRNRNVEVEDMLSRYDLMCIGLNNNGTPKHPLITKFPDKLRIYHAKTSARGKKVPA
jgi:hypothetical protein